MIFFKSSSIGLDSFLSKDVFIGRLNLCTDCRHNQWLDQMIRIKFQFQTHDPSCAGISPKDAFQGLCRLPERHHPPISTKTKAPVMRKFLKSRSPSCAIALWSLKIGTKQQKSMSFYSQKIVTAARMDRFLAVCSHGSWFEKQGAPLFRHEPCYLRSPCHNCCGLQD